MKIWEFLCSRKCIGGFNLCDLNVYNEALLGR